ncbi:MAG: RiPP maturation radical SAM C-methyltransferase, partial [Nocardioidaceae bacterium]
VPWSHLVHLVIAVLPWQALPHANAAAGLLANAVAPEHTASVYYGSLDFAEQMLEAEPEVVAGSPGLDFGPQVYQQVASAGFVAGFGEWLFTSALYDRVPDQVPEEPLAAAEAVGIPRPAGVALYRMASSFADHAAREILARNPDVVGFTTSFAQTVACLAVARRVRELAPEVPLVFGGSNCDGAMGAGLIEAFGDCIDFVVRREGEAPLRALLAALGLPAGAERDAALSAIAGLCWRRDGALVVNPETAALPRGEDFPRIEQGDFLARYEQSPVASYMSPHLVFETSRGCWWGAKKHCKFCGLDDLILPFRAKPAGTVAEELRELVGTHKVLDVLTTDNILEKSYFTDLLPGLAADRPDWRLFYEIKANLSPDKVKVLREAGVIVVQPGIENLHSTPLKLMDKGTTGVNNVAALRDLQQAGITVRWNYLAGFPGERDEHYDEVTAQLPRLWHLQPPPGCDRIVLERFNPYFLRPELGFEERTPMRWYDWAYPGLSPQQREQIAYLFEAPARGASESALTRLREAIAAWNEAYPTSRLTHRRVGEELWIYDRRAGRPARDLCLTDPREVAAYLHLARGESPARLTSGLDGVSTQWCEGFVAELDAHGLVYGESGRWVTLSLEDDPARIGFSPPARVPAGAGVSA